ncbi:MAG TPA: hypothetical protein VIV11_38345 [Kofleriaceae bacterium]
MTKKYAVLAGVVVIAGAIALFVWSRRDKSPGHAKGNTTSVHATGIDQADSSVSMLTMLNAPEGATPCETAFNALDAEQTAARLRKGKSMFKWVAPKQEFLAQCQQLPAETQRCMMPRYRREHDDCAAARPPDAVLHKMVIPEPVAEEKLPGEE